MKISKVNSMTDLEITKACAEAMGYGVGGVTAKGFLWVTRNVSHLEDGGNGNLCSSNIYDPLHNDAQAMALVKKFEIAIAFSWVGQMGCMAKIEAQRDENKRHDNIQCTYKDLNRAICECVANIQNAKHA